MNPVDFLVESSVCVPVGWLRCAFGMSVGLDGELLSSRYMSQ